VTVAVLLGVLAGYLVIRHRQQELLAALRPAGIRASVPTALADQMQLSTVPARTAPGFTLASQDGRTVSLAAFKGRPLVLTFMDPHCTDICPPVSAEFLAAYHHLGPAAARAVFIAVNVNPYYRTPADVAAFCRAHQLTAIPAWYFLTGSLASLRAVWDSYEIAVQATSRTAAVVHTSPVYFIGPSGRERYVAVPMDEHTASMKAHLPAVDPAAWARGVALVARSLATSR
jgi:cytochrome oxidase Cu insertion factor (SCO1/SenC/PrrC family)